jgi:hypothetical protein
MCRSTALAFTHQTAAAAAAAAKAVGSDIFSQIEMREQPYHTGMCVMMGGGGGGDNAFGGGGSTSVHCTVLANETV